MMDVNLKIRLNLLSAPYKMLSRFTYGIFILLLLIGVSSCKTHHGTGPKEYIERNGLNDARKPSQLAKELGNQGKGQKRAYRRELYKQWKKKHPGEPRRTNPYR